MNWKHLRKRIISRSNFSFSKINDRVEVLCECLDFKSHMTSYQITDNYKISDSTKHHLVGLLINQTYFLQKFQQIENRENNLNKLTTDDTI